MNRFQQVGVPRERLQGGGVIGPSPVAHLVLWCVSVGERAPRDVILHVPPDPRNGAQRWTVGGPPPVSAMRWPGQAVGGMRATVIQEEDGQTVWEGLGQGIDEALEHRGIPLGQLQQEALARGGGYGPRDIAPCEDVLDEPHGLDAAGR
jgi:hypothetical protein